MDPLLRAAIWTHLEDLCRQSATTIIITTHYIEEARAATTIGLMRNGRLLVQSAPEVLLAEHGLDRLEDVFLKLCLQQDTEFEEREKQKAQNSLEAAQQEETNVDAKTEEDEDKNNNNNHGQQKKKKPKQKKQSAKAIEAAVDPRQPTFAARPALSFDPYRFNALFTKNIVRLRRNLFITFFYALSPALQFGLFILTAGKTPANLPVAVVNEERPADLTAKFLSYLAPGSLVQHNFTDLKEAEKMVVEGKAWAVLHFGANFSTALDDRRIDVGGRRDYFLKVFLTLIFHSSLQQPRTRPSRPPTSTSTWTCPITLSASPSSRTSFSPFAR